MERSLEEVVMLFDKRLASGEELSPDVCERAVGSEMTRVGGGIPGIPGSNLFLNDVSNGPAARNFRIRLTTIQQLGLLSVVDEVDECVGGFFIS
jgi:hypothetical protein